MWSRNHMIHITHFCSLLCYKFQFGEKVFCIKETLTFEEHFIKTVSEHWNDVHMFD